MNKTNRLRAEFRPETRFEVRPLPPAPFRATQETEFERLKNRLLTERLLATGRPELNTPIRRAANEAAALAWVTFVPLLVFPTLFEEKIRAAIRQAERQAHIYATSPELVAA
ncbi:MAG TPA: hypothetical protein VF988_06030 [Verrucomicrobiae bacterium]